MDNEEFEKRTRHWLQHYAISFGRNSFKSTRDGVSRAYTNHPSGCGLYAFYDITD